MLRIVQHQQQMPGREVLDNGLRQVLSRLLLEPEDVGHRLRYEPRFRQRGELHQPDAVRIGFQQVPRHLHRQAGLAAAAGANEGEQPRRAEQLLDLRDLLLAADEAGQLLRQVVFWHDRFGAGKGEFQELAQRGHLRLQAVLFDDHLRPHALEQFVLGYQMPVAFNQHYQQIESTRANIDRRAGCQQASFIGL